jgi:ATP-binding cassette subfamily C (CFTR/MRP) protein 1
MGLATFTTKFQMAWVGMIEKRIGKYPFYLVRFGIILMISEGFTSSVLASMKSIKILGLSTKVSTQLHKSRANEIDAAAKFRILSVFSSSLGSVPMLISPVATFAIFVSMAVKKNITLDPTKLFTSLSLLILLSEPLFSLFLGVMDLMSAFGCFNRIEKFLLSTSREDKRTVIGNKLPIIENESPASKENSGAMVSHSNDMALIIRNGAFGWSNTEEPVLRNIDLNISKGQLVAIVGPVGVGKSTLLKAILGETPRHQGEVQVAKADIAWCEQEAWLINNSVQENIVGFSDFDPKLYKEVIHCCDLAQDLATLPHGDQTKIGSKGMSLSGGQKQRVVRTPL